MAVAKGPGGALGRKSPLVAGAGFPLPEVWAWRAGGSVTVAGVRVFPDVRLGKVWGMAESLSEVGRFGRVSLRVGVTVVGADLSNIDADGWSA